MVDKSELAIATSQAQNPIPFFIELLFNLLSQMITVSTIKLTSQPVSSVPYEVIVRLEYYTKSSSLHRSPEGHDTT
ncbi:MAG: hypothetical protein O4805_13145 [Trichodesmium sp. St16_bin2-tuft]|nr:hypothetical protein [Trichodesmium sp. St16_bin2-tuft]